MNASRWAKSRAVKRSGTQCLRVCVRSTMSLVTTRSHARYVTWTLVCLAREGAHAAAYVPHTLCTSAGCLHGRSSDAATMQQLNSADFVWFPQKQ